MATDRLPMRQLREILRLKWAAHRSHREVARSLGVSPGAVASVVSRARHTGLTWAAVDALTDEALEARLYGPAPGTGTIGGMNECRSQRLRGGKWGDRQIVPTEFVKAAVTRSQHGPDYGYLWWLNTQGKNYPGLPANAYGARGAGSNTITVLPDQDLVVVWRWHAGNEAEFVKRTIGGMNECRSQRNRPYRTLTSGFARDSPRSQRR